MSETAGEVNEEVIAEVVSKITGVPLTRLEEAESARLLQLEAELHKMVVSQQAAVTHVAKSIRKARSGLKDPNRPMGCFSSWDPPVWARHSWPRRSASSCSATRTQWSIWTCPNTWRSTRSPDWLVPLRIRRL